MSDIEIKKAAPEGNFFLKRPVLSTVISIFVLIVGAICIGALPIEQLPNLTPPQVSIKATYTGASSETLSTTVASLIESKVNGVDDMIYMDSNSDSQGNLNINVFFNVGTDPDQATINVNNRVQQANAQLPYEVQRKGVVAEKQSSSILLMVCLNSPDNRYDSIYLSNYVLINILDELKRLPGVSDAQNFAGQDYSMRIWLKPDKMAKLKITYDEVSNAINDQNAQFAAGTIGSDPIANPISLKWQVTTLGRLWKPEQFEDIIIRTEKDGAILRLKDIAKVELGAESYAFKGFLQKQSTVPIGIYLAPGANALATAELVKNTMKELEKSFPSGVAYTIPYDTTKFVDISIETVVHTLFEAMLLVFFVVFLFLQNWRATLIPCLAVPVSIVGTFAGMYAFHLSINTLTMFGLVLAIGIVVDDAIVVLENVERHMEDGLNVRDATNKAMAEVTAPVIAIVLVLCSVFVPMAFIGGMSGIMYRQFAVTIAISVVISGMVALTFTPALCALLLKPSHGKPNAFFRAFNTIFEKITGGYVGIVRLFLKRSILTIALFGTVIGGIIIIGKAVPTGLLPAEDQGYYFGLIMLPDGASLDRSAELALQMSEMLEKDPAIDNVLAFAGFDITTGSRKSNYCTFFVTLKDWKERLTPETSVRALIQKYNKCGLSLKDGVAMAFMPPTIMGMGNTGGFEMWIQDRSGGSYVELDQIAKKVIAKASERPELLGVSTAISVNSPEIYADLDREKARSLGVNVSDVFNAMQAAFGSQYINDFNLYGKTFRVYIQADSNYRDTPDKIKEIYVLNKNGEMVPIESLLKIKYRSGPIEVTRFNNFAAAKIFGNAAPGYSSGQALTAIEAAAREVLPQGYTIGWSGESYQQKQTEGGLVSVLVLALIMVFLILAAQYESWSLPLSVLTAVPFGILGGLGAVYLRGFSNDIYFHVALITLIGLSAKNAILIVEFAVDKVKKEGMSFIEAAAVAAELRFRPIIMTSLAFILGCVPLAISTNAGAASQQDIGTSVIGGMILATGVAPMFVPFFFRAIMAISAKLTKAATEVNNA